MIFLLGPIVVGLAAFVELRISATRWAHFVLWPPLIIGAAIAMLRPLKAGLIALHYRYHLLQSPPLPPFLPPLAGKG